MSKNVHNVRKSIYDKDRALAEKRKQEAKEREIQELQETIDSGMKRLAELSNDATVDTGKTLERYTKILEFIKNIP